MECTTFAERTLHAEQQQSSGNRGIVDGVLVVAPQPHLEHPASSIGSPTSRPSPAARAWPQAETCRPRRTSPGRCRRAGIAGEAGPRAPAVPCSSPGTAGAGAARSLARSSTPLGRRAAIARRCAHPRRSSRGPRPPGPRRSSRRRPVRRRIRGPRPAGPATGAPRGTLSGPAALTVGVRLTVGGTTLPSLWVADASEPERRRRRRVPAQGHHEDERGEDVSELGRKSPYRLFREPVIQDTSTCRVASRGGLRGSGQWTVGRRGPIRP